MPPNQEPPITLADAFLNTPIGLEACFGWTRGSQIQENIVNVVRDVVQRYDVAGVHFDDYFYPYPTDSGHVYAFPDDATYAAYRTRGGTLRKPIGVGIILTLSSGG